MTTSNLHELNTISEILAGGLGSDYDLNDGLPLEVNQALKTAREQMSSLPEVIKNYKLSMEKYYTVSAALKRMLELADASAKDITDPERIPLNEEFAGLARIIAADAGQQYYTGPILNLNNQTQALSTAKILGYMKPVIVNTGQDLYEHQKLIQEIINETLDFLTTVTQCYPESEGATRLNHLLNQTNQASPFTVPTGRYH